MKLSGKIVFVKEERGKMKEDGKPGRPYKRLQLLENGGKQRAGLLDVSDMSNREWVYGSEVEIDVGYKLYQTKSGVPGIQFTYWGNDQDAGIGQGQPGPVGSKFAGGK